MFDMIKVHLTLPEYPPDQPPANTLFWQTTSLDGGGNMVFILDARGELWHPGWKGNVDHNMPTLEIHRYPITGPVLMYHPPEGAYSPLEMIRYRVDFFRGVMRAIARYS